MYLTPIVVGVMVRVCLSKFLKNHPEISLEMYSGGLFVGGETIKASMLEHVKESNARITRYYGVPFGDTYESNWLQVI